MMMQIAAAAIALAALTPQTTPSPSPSATPAPVPSFTPIPLPSFTPIPLPSFTPVPMPTFSPLATPSPLPTPLVLPADAPPQILAVAVSDPVLHSGELVTGTVVTSTNVSAVEIHFGGRIHNVPEASAGIWQVTYRMPRVPFFMRGRSITAQVVASNAGGQTAAREMTVALR